MSKIMGSRSTCAMKVHTCDWCNNLIVPGDIYTANKLLGDDGFYTWKECERCSPYVHEMFNSGYLATEEADSEDFLYFMQDMHRDVYEQWEEDDELRQKKLDEMLAQ